MFINLLMLIPILIFGIAAPGYSQKSSQTEFTIKIKRGCGTSATSVHELIQANTGTGSGFGGFLTQGEMKIVFRNGVLTPGSSLNSEANHCCEAGGFAKVVDLYFADIVQFPPTS